MIHYVLGTVALLGLGLIGWLIEQHKQDNYTINDLIITVEQLSERNVELMGNQKPAPWNKGKKGYKQPRKAKTAEFNKYQNFSQLLESKNQGVADTL